MFYKINLMRTREKGLVVVAIPKDEIPTLVVLNPSRSTLPLLKDIGYAIDVSGAREEAQVIQYVSLENVEENLATFGISSAKAAARLTTVNSLTRVGDMLDTELYSAQAEDYLTALCTAFYSPFQRARMQGFLAFLSQEVLGDDLYEGVIYNYPKYGIFYAGPVIKSFFRDMVAAMIQESSFDQDGKLTGHSEALKVINDFMAADRADKIPLGTAAGFSLWGFTQSFTALMAAVEANATKRADVEKFQLILSLVLIKAFVGSSNQSAAKDTARGWFAEKYKDSKYDYKTLFN